MFGSDFEFLYHWILGEKKKKRLWYLQFHFSGKEYFCEKVWDFLLPENNNLYLGLHLYTNTQSFRNKHFTSQMSWEQKIKNWSSTQEVSEEKNYFICFSHFKSRSSQTPGYDWEICGDLLTALLYLPSCFFLSTSGQELQ